jgi:hypothetical protein
MVMLSITPYVSHCLRSNVEYYAICSTATIDPMAQSDAHRRPSSVFFYILRIRLCEKNSIFDALIALRNRLTVRSGNGVTCTVGSTHERMQSARRLIMHELNIHTWKTCAHSEALQLPSLSPAERSHLVSSGMAPNATVPLAGGTSGCAPCQKQACARSRQEGWLCRGGRPPVTQPRRQLPAYAYLCVITTALSQAPC